MVVTFGGFLPTGTNRWAAPLAADRFALVTFQPLKGRRVAVRWGVSLTYVPHRLVPTPAWHRTLKQARLDLWTSSQEHPDGSVVLSTIHGADRALADIERLAELCIPAARTFWTEATTDEGVLRVASSQARAEEARRVMRHAPDCRLIAALAAARLGRTEAAGEWLRSARLGDADRLAVEELLS